MPDIFSSSRALWSALVCAFFLLACAHSNPISASSKKTKADTASLRKLFFAVRDQPNPDTGIILLNNLLLNSEGTRDNWLIGNTLLKLGEYYMVKGDYVHALTCMTRAQPYCSTLSVDERANYYQHIGWVYIELGDYVTASENFFTALGLKKKGAFNCTGSVSICNDLGDVYFRLHQNEKALAYFNQGEEIAYKNHFQNCIANILCNKGEYYTSIRELDSARKLYSRVNDIGDRVDRPDVKASALQGIGKTFIKSGEYDKAAGYLQKAIALSENRYKSLWIESSFLLGEVWYKRKKYDQAQTILLSALREASACKQKNSIINGYTTLAAVYKETGQHTKALDCMDSILMLKESLESSEKTKAIYLMDIKYHTAEKDRQIANNLLLLARKDGEMARKNMSMLIIAGGILLLLLLSVVAYLHILNKQRTLEKENKISVLKAAIQGGDDERRRIARELHDGIGGMLSAAMMRFSSMRTGGPDVTAIAGYTDAMGILHEMGDEIRKTAHNLMPEVLVKQSLPEAIRTYCNSVQVAGGLQIHFQDYGSFDGLSQDYKLNLYRIVQELVKNVIQHAQAKHALVQLVQNENVLIVSVEDDGRGFDKNDIKSGQGLYNTQTRVGSLDGHFTLETNPGKGTSVFIEFKINKPSMPGVNEENSHLGSSLK